MVEDRKQAQKKKPQWITSGRINATLRLGIQLGFTIGVAFVLVTVQLVDPSANVNRFILGVFGAALLFTGFYWMRLWRVEVFEDEMRKREEREQKDDKKEDADRRG